MNRIDTINYFLEIKKPGYGLDKFALASLKTNHPPKKNINVELKRNLAPVKGGMKKHAAPAGMTQAEINAIIAEYAAALGAKGKEPTHETKKHASAISERLSNHMVAGGLLGGGLGGLTGLGLGLRSGRALDSAATGVLIGDGIGVGAGALHHVLTKPKGVEKAVEAVKDHRALLGAAGLGAAGLGTAAALHHKKPEEEAQKQASARVAAIVAKTIYGEGSPQHLLKQAAACACGAVKKTVTPSMKRTADIHKIEKDAAYHLSEEWKWPITVMLGLASGAEAYDLAREGKGGESKMEKKFTNMQTDKPGKVGDIINDVAEKGLGLSEKIKKMPSLAALIGGGMGTALAYPTAKLLTRP